MVRKNALLSKHPIRKNVVDLLFVQVVSNACAIGVRFEFQEYDRRQTFSTYHQWALNIRSVNHSNQTMRMRSYRLHHAIAVRAIPCIEIQHVSSCKLPVHFPAFILLRIGLSLTFVSRTLARNLNTHAIP